MENVQQNQFQLIVTVVNKGLAADVIDAGKSAGADGGTILHGRGSGIHETSKFFNVFIEPEKEIVFTLVKDDLTETVLAAISKAIDIEKPGHGIAFVADISKVIGISHLNKQSK